MMPQTQLYYLKPHIDILYTNTFRVHVFYYSLNCTNASTYIVVHFIYNDYVPDVVDGESETADCVSVLSTLRHIRPHHNLLNKQQLTWPVCALSCNLPCIYSFEHATNFTAVRLDRSIEVTMILYRHFRPI